MDTQINFKVNYDDMPHDAAYSAVAAANTLLKQHGLELNIFDDGESHDGFIIMVVELKSQTH